MFQIFCAHGDLLDQGSPDVSANRGTSDGLARRFLGFAGVAATTSKEADKSSESVGAKNDKLHGVPNGEESIDGMPVGG